ncbi:hypothetical protein BC831DRAFT_29205 [Entophlyctis helioformis]|nr:hypothetical protein BC831DRAFT_29205 [Entophlyctis helioformis]
MADVCVGIHIHMPQAANVTVRQAAAADANATAVFSYTLQYSEDTPIAASKIETSFEDGKAMLSIETATLPSHRGRYVKFKLTGDLVVPIGFYQPPSIAGLDLDVSVRYGSIVVQPVASESQPETVVFGSLNIATGAGVAKVAVGGHLAAKTVSIKTNAGTVSAGNLLVDESVAIKTRAGNVDASEVSVHGGSVNLATDAGNVHATVKGYASLVATTGAGNIDLAVEPAQGSATNAESGAGNVKLSVVSVPRSSWRAGYLNHIADRFHSTVLHRRLDTRVHSRPRAAWHCQCQGQWIRRNTRLQLKHIQQLVGLAAW